MAQLSVGDMIIYQMSSEMAVYPSLVSEVKRKKSHQSSDQTYQALTHSALSFLILALASLMTPYTPLPLPSALQRQSAAPAHQQGRQTGRVSTLTECHFLSRCNRSKNNPLLWEVISSALDLKFSLP